MHIYAMDQGQPQPAGYEQRQDAVRHLLHGLAPIVPPEVVIAMRFIEHCNEHMAAPYTFRDEEGFLDSGLVERELPGCQEGAFRRACVLLGRYFDGRGPRRANQPAAE